LRDRASLMLSAGHRPATS